MSFQKLSISDLESKLSSLVTTMKEQQATLTQLVANVVYQSVYGRNVDPAKKLIGALTGNGYNRTNDVITYLCRMGNFKYNKKDGLMFKQVFNPDQADEIAELCVSNPMFSLVREPAVKTEIDILADLQRYLKKVKRQIKEANEENRQLKVVHDDLIAKLEAIAS